MANLDPNGLVLPYDDATISVEGSLIRKIHPQHLKPMSNGQRRVSKAAFSGSSRGIDPYQGMSVDLYSVLVDNGVDPESPNYAPEFEVLMMLRVGDLRQEQAQLQLVIGRDPKPDNPAHCSVWGVRSSHRKHLLGLARWLRRPEDVVKFQNDTTCN